jgi:hypothetical protein
VSVGISVGGVPHGQGSLQLHTLLRLRGNILTFIHISDGKVHGVNILDQLLPESTISKS